MLAATCLTIAGSATAVASTFFETSVATTDLDFFEFNGLLGGQSFALTGSTVSNDFFMLAFDSTNTPIGTQQELFNTVNEVITATAPSDGFLIVVLKSSSEANSGAYVVTLDAGLVPEPTAALARRRRK